MLTLFITLLISSILGLALCFYVQGKKFYQMVRQMEINEQLYNSRIK